MPPRRLQDASGRWQCSKCRIFKEASEFSPHPIARSGLQSWCRRCARGGGPTRAERVAREQFEDFLTQPDFVQRAIRANQDEESPEFRRLLWDHDHPEEAAIEIAVERIFGRPRPQLPPLPD